MITTLETLAERFSMGLVTPLTDIVNRGSARHYWLYVLTGLVIAWAVHAARRPEASFRETFFAREIWLGPSAQIDYILFFLARAIVVAFISVLLFKSSTIAAWTSDALRFIGVSGSVSESSVWLVAALLTVTLFVADDFIHWYTHWIFHRYPALWEFHKVHHSAEHLNFATAERIHPLEAIVTIAFRVIAAGLVNGLFIACAGTKLTPATLAGANVLLVVFNIFGGVLRHSPAWFSFGPRIEKWLISPAMHQIHHSEDPKHFDKNMGGSLAIWDRMFGTLYVPNGYEKITYGIGPETQEFRSLQVNLVGPFVKSARIVKDQATAALRRTRPAENAPLVPTADTK